MQIKIKFYALTLLTDNSKQFHILFLIQNVLSSGLTSYLLAQILNSLEAIENKK